MAKFKKLPENPTNADIANGITQLHACLESHRTETRNAFTKQNNDFNTHISADVLNFKMVNESINSVDKKIETIKAEQAKVKDALGVETKRKPLGLWSQSEVMWKGALGIGSIFAVWKFIAFCLPFIVKFGVGIGSFILALNQWVIK